ncbi:MAG: hypothetical protein ACK44L_11405, partial [Burkholderiales bacterium]
YTVMHDRDGPTGALVFARRPDGTRFMASTPSDRSLLEAIEAQEFIGAQGRVTHDDKTNRFVPS